MKVVILAGGLGTRISEDSHFRPKPMIEIGDKPILWHIMKLYSHYGFNDFIICCGYKQHIIKEWFADYYLNNSDVIFDFARNNEMKINNNFAEPWKVTLVNTGLMTQTGGRIKRVKDYIRNETFMLTYGDGVSNVDIFQLVKKHIQCKALATITAVEIEQRFGILEIGAGNTVLSFREKQVLDSSRINAGFMVLEPDIIDMIADDDTNLEKDVLSKLAGSDRLQAFKHNGFWQPMDTKREHEKLESLWNNANAPWKVW